MITREQKDKIKRLNAGGYLVKEIATRVGVSEQKVRNTLSRAEIPINRVKKKRNPEGKKKPRKKIPNWSEIGTRSLAMAIIERGAVDYRKALRHPHRFKYLKAESERFFRGEYFEQLAAAAETELNGEKIIETIQNQEQERRIKIYEKNRARADREAEILASAAAGLQDDKGSDS